MKQGDSQSREADQEVMEAEIQESEETAEPPKKRFKHLERVSELLSRKNCKRKMTCRG